MKPQVQELLRFIEASPTCFHAVENIAKALTEAGFARLNEGEPWKLEPGAATLSPATTRRLSPSPCRRNTAAVTISSPATAIPPPLRSRTWPSWKAPANICG